MNDDQRLIQLLAISADAARTLSTTMSLAQGASPNEEMRLYERTLELLERGSEGPVNRFNALVRGILGAAAHGGDSQVRSHGNYAERCAVVVADMTRIAHEIVGRRLAVQPTT
jgi:hypothetical protein